MEALEKLIQRFIRREISKIKGRDKEYTLQHLKKEFNQLEKWIDGPKEIKYLYHKYLLGENVLEVLNSNQFYYQLSPSEYPALFNEVKKPVNFRKSFDLPAIIEENIPKARKTFTEAFKKYLAFMELKKWIEKNGIEKLPIISEKPKEDMPIESKLKQVKKYCDMEESEIETVLIKLGNIGELIERRAVMENLLPIDIYEISLRTIKEAIAGSDNTQFKIHYLKEQKNGLIRAKLLYGTAFNSHINHNGRISAIEDIIKFIDENISVEGAPSKILVEETGNLTQEKTFGEFMKNPEWKRIMAKAIEIFWDIDNVQPNTLEYAKLSLQFEDAKEEVYKLISNATNKAETIKVLILQCDEKLREMKMDVLIPGLKEDKLNLLKYKIQGIENLKNFLFIKTHPSKPDETKTEKLKTELSKFGFFDLSKIEVLSNENKEKLVELISSNDLPYCIAMFDYLGYLKHLAKEHFTTKYKLNKEIAKWFKTDKDGRAVKGNISSLLEKTTENKNRYTAYQHKEKVQIDYQKLK